MKKCRKSYQKIWRIKFENVGSNLILARHFAWAIFDCYFRVWTLMSRHHVSAISQFAVKVLRNNYSGTAMFTMIKLLSSGKLIRLTDKN